MQQESLQAWQKMSGEVVEGTTKVIVNPGWFSLR